MAAIEDEAENILDLEDLMAESLGLTKARRAKQLGRKLAPELEELLTSAQVVEQMLVWETQACVAHFVHTGCACGATSRRFGGWYSWRTHKRQGTTRRLLRVDTPDSERLLQHATWEKVPECAECLSTKLRSGADLHEIPLLAELGMDLVDALVATLGLPMETQQ